MRLVEKTAFFKIHTEKRAIYREKQIVAEGIGKNPNLVETFFVVFFN